MAMTHGLFCDRSPGVELDLALLVERLGGVGRAARVSESESRVSTRQARHDESGCFPVSPSP
jgi:hypothetical protein